MTLIKTVREPKKYLSGGGTPKIDRKYDYLLFRQDFGGCESVYFNVADLAQVSSWVESGTILIHPNYSILYARDADALQKAVAIGEWCYGLTYDEAEK